jgi:hypothetical protein
MRPRNAAIEIVRAGGSLQDASEETGLDVLFVNELINKERDAVSQKARGILDGADVAVIRAIEQSLMSDEWLGWREAIRAAVRGESLVLPPEPERRARNPHMQAPVNVAMPEFLKGADEPIPTDLADLFDPADTAPQSNEKLLVRLREVLGLIGLAEDAGGRAAPELYRRKDRLESGIRWNRGRSAEVI